MYMIDLPEGWALSTLPDSIGIDGLISDGDWVESKDQDPNGSIRLIQLADIGDGDFKNKSERFMSPDRADALNCTYLKSGDVLIARMPDPLGRACLFPDIGQDAVTVVDICLIRTGKNTAISNKLLIHWINSPSIRDLIYANASGTTRTRITRKKLELFEFPIPPLAEQKVIADKLDTLLAQVEAIKVRLESILNILRTFRQSVLSAAVNGKLTEEWRLKNKLSNVVVEHNPDLPKLTPNEYYSDTVEGWQWIRLGSVVSLINGDRGRNYPNKSEYVEQGIPFINTGHINTDGTLADGRMNFISEAKYSSLSGGKTKSTDLVYCLRGATMGKTARVHYKIGAIASSLVIVRPSDHIDRDFAYYFLISPPAKNLISEFDNGSAQPNLSAKSLATYPLQLPSFREQIEIVKRVEELFNFAAHAETKATISLEHVNNLTQSILVKAFRGELTADWREANPDLISDDNSAEAWLEKIKIKRETLKKQPKLKQSTVKKKTGSHMSKQTIKVTEALKQAGEPLSGQQLLKAAGYPSDSNTEQLEQFFLDIRNALVIEKSIVKLERDVDSQDWFTLAKDTQ